MACFSWYRVLLERLIVNRPHPWGLLITFIELIKNPAFKFWSHDFVHCAPEIEKWVTLKHCCNVCVCVCGDLTWLNLLVQAVPVCGSVLHGAEAGPAGDGGHRCHLGYRNLSPEKHLSSLPSSPPLTPICSSHLISASTGLPSTWTGTVARPR